MFRFPWGDMHSLNLGWFLQKFNELRADWATAEENITGALDAEIQRAEDALSDVFDARDAAAASATAAAGSASAAGTSATAAQNSATGAASSATLANQKATAAGLSEAAAAQSATAAGNSATAAAGSATQAGQSATNAAASETAAGNSATAAAGSATAAAASETNAAASAARAEEVEQSIPEDYTELTNEVSNLRADLSLMGKNGEFWGLFANKDPISSPNSPIRYIDSNIRICIPTIIEAAENIIVKTDPPYQFAIISVDENYTYASTTGWQTAYTIPVGTKFTIVARLSNNGNITKEEVDNIIFNNDIKSNSNYNTADLIRSKASIAPILCEYIADAALVINDFRFVGNTLYRITAPITLGGALIPNTNCIAITLTEVIKTLLS